MPSAFDDDEADEEDDDEVDEEEDDDDEEEEVGGFGIGEEGALPLLLFELFGLLNVWS